MKAPKFLKNRQLMFPFYVLFFFLLVALGFTSLKKPPEKKAEDNKVPLVSVQTVALSPAQLTVKSQGIFQPKFNTSLVAQVSGEIVSLSENFVRGGVVKKGQLLAQIDPFNYEVQLEEAKATLASAEAALQLEKAQGKVAEAEWSRVNDTAPSALGLRKPQLEQAIARVKSAEAGLKQASKNIQRTQITAPYDALVNERLVSLGTFVGTGEGVGNLLDVSSGEVRLPIPSKEQQFLIAGGVGAPVQLSADFMGESHTWHGSIVRSEGIIDEHSRMVYLVAELKNPYGLNLPAGETPSSPSRPLPFGAYVNAEIAGVKLASATSIPAHLVNGNRIALLEDNKLRFQAVTVARTVGATVIVSAGLSDGDTLVSSSLDYPSEGMALEPILNTPSDIIADDGEKDPALANKNDDDGIVAEAPQ